VSFKLFSSEGRQGSRRTLGEAMRPVGRLALWAALAVLLIRGATAIVAAPAGPDRRAGHSGPGRRAESLAVGFARTYLESPTPEALSPFLAGGAHVGTGRPPSAAGRVTQASVSDVARVDDDRWVITVSCDLQSLRTVDLAVPGHERG